MAISISRLPKVLALIGWSNSTHYARINDGLWTKPVSIGLRMSGWPDDENAELIAAYVAGKSPDEIRALVVKLEAARKTAALAEPHPTNFETQNLR